MSNCFESLVDVCSQVRPPPVAQSAWRALDTTFLTSPIDSSTSQGNRPTWQPPNKSECGPGSGQNQTSLRDPGDDASPTMYSSLLSRPSSTARHPGQRCLSPRLSSTRRVSSSRCLFSFPLLDYVRRMGRHLLSCLVIRQCPTVVGVEHFCGIEVSLNSVVFYDPSDFLSPSFILSPSPSFYAPFWLLH